MKGLWEQLLTDPNKCTVPQRQIPITTPDAKLHKSASALHCGRCYPLKPPLPLSVLLSSVTAHAGRWVVGWGLTCAGLCLAAVSPPKLCLPVGSIGRDSEYFTTIPNRQQMINYSIAFLYMASRWSQVYTCTATINLT